MLKENWILEIPIYRGWNPIDTIDSNDSLQAYVQKNELQQNTPQPHQLMH